MTLYNLKSADGEYRITKFDDDLNPVEGSSYIVSFEECTCPAGSRPTCRHRQMLPVMIDRMDTPWFYDYEDGMWQDPLGEAEVEMFAPVPEGVAVLGLDDAEKLHNTVAEAVGEPFNRVRRRI